MMALPNLLSHSVVRPEQMDLPIEGLEACFPQDWHELAQGAGSGLRELLAQDAVLGEALHTCEVGLLRGRGVTLDNLRATGERVLVDIIEPLEEAAGEEPPAAPPSSR